MNLTKALIIAAALVCLAVPAMAAQEQAQPTAQAQQTDPGAELINKIAQAEQTGDFKLVFDACQEALKSGKLNWAQELYTYQNRGMSYFVQHKYNEALADFKTITDKQERVIAYYTHNPNESMYKVLRMMLPAAYMMSSIIYEQQGKPAAALKYLEEYFKVSGVDPDDADLKRRRELKKKLGQLD